MIRVKFRQSEGMLTGFSVSGHAGYDEYGKDIVCASVTSAVQLTANGITEIQKLPAQVKVNENTIQLQVPKEQAGQAGAFLNALLLHLRLLSQEYEGTIEISVKEN